MSMTFTIAHRSPDAWHHGECDATFNVHNEGGCAILRAIGVDAEPVGSHDAAEVLARCVAWRATHSYAPVWHTPGVGVDDAYVAVRVGWLEELARLCVASGAWVGWS